VASRLAVSPARAEKLIELVCTAATSDEVPLPLVSEDGGREVTLHLVAEGLRGRRLRLTRSETIALVAALKRLNVEENDPLFRRLSDSLAQEGLDPELVERRLGSPLDQGVSQALSVCALARVRREELGFGYRRVGEKTEEERRVAPRALRHEEGSWYLDALDLDRQGERTFRVDRMARARCLGPVQAGSSEEKSRRRFVDVTFSDERYLQLLPWHDLEARGTDAKGHVHATLPYYGGAWLPRMLVACAGTAMTDDAEVNAAARAYASGQLPSPRA
jgi:proteasome accessory factor C